MTDISGRCTKCLRELESEDGKCSFCGNIDKQSESFKKGTIEAGTVVKDRYLLGDSLRDNGQYIVYVAYDKHLDVYVNIKEYMPRDIAYRNKNSVIPKKNKKGIYNKGKDEFLKLHKKLLKFRTMTNIEQIFNVIEDNNTVYVVLEELKGQILSEYLSENYGELSWQQSGPMFIDLIKAIIHLHNIGIVHLGISPYTIMVEDDGTFKLIDFSTKQLRMKKTEITPQLFEGYVAYEQYEGVDCGAYTDVYALAATMYKTLTGTMPIVSNTRHLNDNLIAPDILNEDIPKNVSLSIISALTVSSKLRTQTMEDFHVDIITPPRATQRTIKIINKIEDEGKKEDEYRPKTKKLIFKSLLASLTIVLIVFLVIILVLFKDKILG